MAVRDEAARKRARRLLARGGLSRAEIARRCGVHPSTLANWIAAGGWRIGAAAPRAASRSTVPKPERTAQAPSAPIAPERWAAAREACPGPEAGLDGPTLRLRLRRHVARQIAVLDAQLGQDLPSAPRAPDSARTLRDVTGLKRVIDALDHEDGARGGTEDAGAGNPDLAALREAIARRYEAFAGDGPTEDFSREPA